MTEPPRPAPGSNAALVASVRPARPADRAALAALIAADGLFHADEIAVALELVDAALASPAGDYRVLVAGLDGVGGYLCYGPTPMTLGTFDLYWIVTDPARRGAGLGSALVEAMEAILRADGARLVRVETSSTELYGAAQRFYRRHAYPEVARLADFYRPGDDLVIMTKRL